MATLAQRIINKINEEKAIPLSDDDRNSRLTINKLKNLKKTTKELYSVGDNTTAYIELAEFLLQYYKKATNFIEELNSIKKVRDFQRGLSTEQSQRAMDIFVQMTDIATILFGEELCRQYIYH